MLARDGGYDLKWDMMIEHYMVVDDVLMIYNDWYNFNCDIEND